MGCVVELSAEIFTPGLVQRNTTRSGTWFAPGELDGVVTPRAREIQSILRHVGKVDLPANIYGAKWTKLVVNSMTMGPFSLLGLRSGDALELPGIYEVAVKLGRETLAVGAALGYRIEPVFGLRADEFAGSSDEILVTAMKTLLGHTGKRSRTAPIHDRLKGRRTEMDYINGLVSRQGRTVNVPTPCNDAVTEMARQINRGLMQMDPANLQLLKQRIGIA
jgi:2-dehydropantoate 2-reductase